MSHSPLENISTFVKLDGEFLWPSLFELFHRSFWKQRTLKFLGWIKIFLNLCYINLPTVCIIFNLTLSSPCCWRASTQYDAATSVFLHGDYHFACWPKTSVFGLTSPQHPVQHVVCVLHNLWKTLFRIWTMPLFWLFLHKVHICGVCFTNVL